IMEIFLLASASIGIALFICAIISMMTNSSDSNKEKDENKEKKCDLIKINDRIFVRKDRILQISISDKKYNWSESKCPSVYFTVIGHHDSYQREFDANSWDEGIELINDWIRNTFHIDDDIKIFRDRAKINKVLNNGETNNS